MGRKQGQVSAQSFGSNAASESAGPKLRKAVNNVEGDVTEKSGKVIGFYSDREGNAFREFSNFYRHAQPYEFHLPSFALREGFPKTIWCNFSEKAIMATKAALMGDLEILQSINDADDPKSCKALGRGVRGFDEELWQLHLEETAFEVVRQKFAADRSAQKVLLSTGDKILAEAAPNDCIWGIGLSLRDARVKCPEEWRGRNILGYALMRARDHIRGIPSGIADSTTPLQESTAGGPDFGSSESTAASSASSMPSQLLAPAVERESETPSQPPVMVDADDKPLLLYRDADAQVSRLTAATELGPVKIIFLDVDGVLNNKTETRDVVDCADQLLPQCMGRLQEALESSGARVVLSTTWRSDPALRATLVNALERMRPGCVVGQTLQDPSFRNDMRPAEIANFLQLPEVRKVLDSPEASWCAVDDMNLVKQAEALAKQRQHWEVRSLLPELGRRFVRTEKQVGLDADGVRAVQRILTASP